MINIEKQRLMNFLQEMVECFPLGVLAMDMEGNVFIYNRQMGELEGRDPRQVLGKRVSDLYETDHPAREMLTLLKCGQPITDTNRFFFGGPDREVPLITSIYPLAEQGRVVALAAVTGEDHLLEYIMKKELQRPEQPYSPGLDTFSNAIRAGSSFFHGISASAKAIREQVLKAASGNLPVLVSGEPGTGKEIIARAIHSLGGFSEGPFLTLNCGLGSPVLQEEFLFGSSGIAGEENRTGLIEQARGGALYIEQLENMGLPVQSRLLRFLQEKRFLGPEGSSKMAADCRLIAAAGVDPEKLAADGLLRKDLYLQLAGETIDIPPLRQRKTDILVLAGYYLEVFCRQCGGGPKRFSKKLAVFLETYSWPGNHRELAYAVETAVFLARGERDLQVEHLPPYLQIRHGRPRERERERAKGGAVTVGREGSGGAPEKSAGRTLNSRLLEFEKQVILESLVENEGNITRTAGVLGLARQNLQYRLKKLGIAGFKPG